MAYLRRHPDAVMQQQSGSLSLVRGRLTESHAAYRARTASMRASWLCLPISMDSSWSNRRWAIRSRFQTHRVYPQNCDLDGYKLDLQRETT